MYWRQSLPARNVHSAGIAFHGRSGAAPVVSASGVAPAKIRCGRSRMLKLTAGPSLNSAHAGYACSSGKEDLRRRRVHELEAIDHRCEDVKV